MDKPVLRINRRHHGSVITHDFVDGAAYAFPGLLHESPRAGLGDGEKAQEEGVSDFRQAIAS